MNNKIIQLLLIILNLAMLTVRLSAQSGNELFNSDSVLKMTLSGNLRDILNDRSDNSKYGPLVISYIQQDGTTISLNAQAKSRGHFRKEKGNCGYPPLLLRFTNNDTLQASVFKDQQKLKLVMPCQGDEYVVYEWLVYRLYNLITPKSFMARLTRVTLDDSRSKKDVSFYGILLEEENQMAKRNGDINVTMKLRPETVPQADFLTMAMFQYMIGNTDWSIQYQQNIKLIAPDSTTLPSPVAYDFDHAGIVDAPYAHPAEELQMRSVRQRRYRGYCMDDLQKFDTVIALYNKIKPAVYNLYTNCTLLDPTYIKSTTKYLDDFYATINDPKQFKKEFSYPCDKYGTGNVVIKGLKGD
jgi:hypothetical protein